MPVTRQASRRFLHFRSVAGLLVGLLAGAVAFGMARSTSAQSIGAPGPAIETPVRLPPLIRQTDTHFQISYWRNPSEQAKRRGQLNEVTAAWRTATRSESNDRRLHVWLRTAIRNSMPGSREPLPPVPAFERPWTPDQATADRVAGNAAAAESSSVGAGGDGATQQAAEPTQPADGNLPDDRSSGDPFRDDPSPDWGTAWSESGDSGSE